MSTHIHGSDGSCHVWLSYDLTAPIHIASTLESKWANL